jgi:hypothetical protein
MSVGTLLSRLRGVKRTGAGRWIACCPAHEDRRPSLSIRELEDGRVLLKCFAECGVREILGALGLGFDALFPERSPGYHVPPERRPFNPSDVLQCIASEALIVAIAARSIVRGAVLSEAEVKRVFVASGRLSSAAEIAG